MVTICTASLTFNNSTFCPHSVFMCFVWISEQTAIISLYNINWLVCITETVSVYCAVRTVSLYIYISGEITFAQSKHPSICSTPVQLSIHPVVPPHLTLQHQLSLNVPTVRNLAVLKYTERSFPNRKSRILFELWFNFVFYAICSTLNFWEFCSLLAQPRLQPTSDIGNLMCRRYTVWHIQIIKPVGAGPSVSPFAHCVCKHSNLQTVL